MKLPIHGSLGPTCKSLKESVLKVPVSSAAYTEYRVVGVPVTTQAQPAPEMVC